MMGWCSSGSHSKVVDGQTIGCPGEYHPFFIERGKMVYRADKKVCDCACHTAGTVVGSVTTKRRRRKK